MPELSRSKAAEIAKAHGLTMSDAAALVQLADTVEEAEGIAGTFAAEQTVDSHALAERIMSSGRGGAR